MELVYLWVENHKNIHHQGFNFSGRYRCDYNPGTNELTIDENKDYVHIFPENINVTAIVGKNGSGKSSILEIIYSFINNQIYQLSNTSCFIIINHANILTIFYTLNIPTIITDIGYKDFSTQKNYERLNFFYCSLYDYGLNLSETYILNFNHPTLYPNKNVHMKLIQQADLHSLVHSLLDTTHKQYFKDYFTPDKILLSENSSTRNNRSNLEEKVPNLAQLKEILTTEIEYFIFIGYQYISNLILMLSLNKNYEFLQKIHTLDDYKRALDAKIKNYVLNFRNDDQKKWLVDEIEHTYRYFETILQNGFVHQFLGIEPKFNADDKKVFNYKFILSASNESSLFLKDYPDCFEIDFKDTQKNFYYHSLSAGEKSILRVRNYLENIIYQNPNQESFIFLFDEMDNELHPDWQKKVIKYLLDIFNERAKKLHFIFNSHSPFILSDLPKENIIFLEDGKQVDVKIDTFGANIHTLLSHGFFMEDGLMGEFAKEKINDVINYLNGKDSEIKNNDEAQSRINMIGEPILKRQLQKMLDSKKLDKLSEIDELKEQIQALKNRLDIVVRNS